MTMTDDLLHQALYESSFWRSHAASRILPQQPPAPEQLLAALSEALSDKEERVRRRAARLIGNILPAATGLPELRRALRDPAWTVRRAAVQALQSSGNEALSGLFAAVLDEVSGVREAATEVLGSQATTSPEAQAAVVPALVARLSDTDEGVREAAALALSRLPIDPGWAVPAFCAALGDESATVRLLAARGLSQMRSLASDAESALLGAINDPVPAVRREVVQALGWVGAEGSVAALLPLLAERGGVREVTAQALAQLGRRLPSVVPRLLESLRKGTAPMRIGALRALACLDSDDALDECRRLARQRDPRLRRKGVRALGWFEAREEVLPDLESALRDSHGKVRKAAAEALGSLRGRAAPALAGLLKRLHDREPRVRTACAAAVAQILPELPAAQQSCLKQLADPAHGPGYNLRAALAHPDLPAAVRTAFVAVCLRRVSWHASHIGQAGSLPAPADSLPAWPAAQAAARQAAHKTSAGSEARAAEFAWLLACLWALLLPSPGSPPDRAEGRSVP
jgi:HEAT repeat protein